MSVFTTRDVIIVGAGPSGSVLAYFLASNGLDVILIDKSEFPRDKTCGDCISPRSLRVLDRINLLSSVRKAGFEVNRVKFFAPNGNRITVTIPSIRGLPDFCVMLPRYDFDSMLCSRAIEAGANFYSHTTAIGLIREKGKVTGVRAQSTTGLLEFHARLTVLATGAATGILKEAGILNGMGKHYVAGRTYYEKVDGLTDAIEFHYDDVPLPGYGWVFPLSRSSANIGIGYQTSGHSKITKHTPKAAFERFLKNSEVSHRLIAAQRSVPFKGYPIRIDFPAMTPAYPGMVLIGEACGLVNPLSGEGIDYALESAEMLAEILIERNKQSTIKSLAIEEEYTNQLRGRFLKNFVGLIRVRDLYMRRWMLNRYISVASRNEVMASLLVNIGLGNFDPKQALSLKSLVQIAFR